MRKRTLIDEIEKLIKINKDYYTKNSSLVKEIEQKDAYIEELIVRQNELIQKIELLESIQNPSEETVVNSSCEVDIVTVDSVDSISIESLPIGDVVCISDRVSYASTVIGRVVVKCAELCNDFASAGYPNSKDLINLALGRTEVFKSEVLQLVSDEGLADADLPSALIEKETAVIEYFQLLEKQV